MCNLEPATQFLLKRTFTGQRSKPLPAQSWMDYRQLLMIGIILREVCRQLRAEYRVLVGGVEQIFQPLR